MFNKKTKLHTIEKSANDQEIHLGSHKE